MTIYFWLIAASFVFLALLILLPPLLRKQEAKVRDDLDKRNVNIARERLAELKANKLAGGISQAQFDEQVAELELALSDDLQLENIKDISLTNGNGHWLAYLLIVAIPLLSGSLYWLLGNYQAINYVPDPNQSAQTAEADQGESQVPSPEVINQMVTKLADKLKAEPNNLEGWLMLGRSYKVLQRYPEAVKAFAQAYKLADEKTEVMLPYAEALAFANNNNWAGQPIELLEKVLQLEPENLAGLWFAAIAKAQRGDKKSALGHLHKLEKLLPEGSPDKQQVQAIIAGSEGKTAQSQQPADRVTATKATPIIAIHVSLAKDLQAKAKPDDKVFIYAQALSGPKMPLAIIQKQVKDLPVSVELSDANSMLPNMKLSNFKQVKLLARISQSGNAMPQAGDLIGTAGDSVELSDKKTHDIVINQQID